MTGDDDDLDHGGPSREPIAELLDQVLASDDQGLRDGVLNVLALLPKVGVARWVLHRAGLLSVALAPVGCVFPDPVPPEAIDAAIGELAEAGLVTIDEAEFDDADDADGDDDGDDADLDDPDLDDSAFDTVTVNPEAAEILMARQAAAGTVAELGDRVCAILDEAAKSGAGIDYALLADGMTACWDSLQPYLGPADDELVRDLLAMRAAGGAS